MNKTDNKEFLEGMMEAGQKTQNIRKNKYVYVVQKLALTGKPTNLKPRIMANLCVMNGAQYPPTSFYILYTYMWYS